ncbi:hypothetical protein WR25_22767 [Diploscapter pachys]|uniref:PNPLA domain-containing protein n=1 Tax=Diploscapter pachys TaxID=2018661 RepID=A0A2A2LSN7_9BILA|nr:hypothetical protein WR25_22767 [Diploscapter pachys]
MVILLVIQQHRQVSTSELRRILSSISTFGSTNAPSAALSTSLPSTSSSSAAAVALNSTPPASSTYYGYLSEALKGILKGSLPAISVTAPSETAQKALAQKVIEKKVSRSEVTQRTNALVKKLLAAESDASRLLRTKELSEHIGQFPPTRVKAVEEPRLIRSLFEIAEDTTREEDLRCEARQCLALCGFQPHVKSRGINLLSIDGGGTRGMMGLEILEQLENKSGKKICELFDHIVGVSTGGIIAYLLGVRKLTVAECHDIYMRLSKRLFSQTKWSGGIGVLVNHSYYNTKLWIDILKEMAGEMRLIESSRAANTPRISIVASIINFPTLQPYVFRNYEHPPTLDSHYRGTTTAPLWKALQATAAAPLYFEEVVHGDFLLQDGGVYANNPTAIALHETRLLWPNERLHCVVSIGNGRSTMDLEPKMMKTSSIQQKILRIIDSATDTEGVHLSLHDILDHDVYYRFNPYMSANYGLDEIDPDKLEQMKGDAKLYTRRNGAMIASCGERLIERPTMTQRVKRQGRTWLNEKGILKPL